MIKLLKLLAQAGGVDTRKLYQTLFANSIKAAIREQSLETLCLRLRKIVPQLTDQYSHGFDQEEYERYWEIKMRGNHAFQIDSALKALKEVGGNDLTLVDLGDSSGNHCRYIKALAPAAQIAKTISVNLDPIAVEKIKAKGGEAILCRAEELEEQGLRPDLLLLFETLEHFSDPLRFLRSMGAEGNIENILLTVPYRRTSRFGGTLLRQPEDSIPKKITPEQVHIFELSPNDWSLMAKLAGYRTSFQQIYLQYPKRSVLRILKPFWRRYDFEGFLALFLRRDRSLSDRYTGW